MLLVLLACTATIRATATPDNATIYLTHEKPSASERPDSYVAKDVGELNVKVPYYTWETWYLWVGASGCPSEVVSVPTEPKAGPIVASVFLFFFPVIWAIGPDDDAILDIELEDCKKASK